MTKCEKSNGLDEYEQFIDNKAKRIGIAGFVIIFALLAVYKLYRISVPTDIIAMFFGFCTLESLSKYYYLRENKQLFLTVCYGIAMTCSIISYVIITSIK